MSNTALDLNEEDTTTRLPNITRAAFCEYVMRLAERFELNYAPDEDSLYHCCEAIAIGLFMGQEDPTRYSLIAIYLQARGVVRFRGE